MKIKYISRISLTARRTFQKKGQSTISNRVLGKIIINNQNIFPLIHKELCQGCSCIGNNILKRRTVTCCRGKYSCIFHCPVFFKSGNNLCNSRSLLSHCHINTDHIFSFLVQDCINSQRGFSCLSVANDQFTLSASDRKHGINRKDSCFKRNCYGFTVNDSRCRIFNRTILLLFDFSLSVYRSAKSIDNPSYKSVSNRNTCLSASSGYF